jgi:DNA-binding transcriptional MerR regulator
MSNNPDLRDSARDDDVLPGKVVALKPYPIGTAARLAGIPPETLRIWERRYQFLEPGRSVGGHRLYSEDDVALLRSVKRLVDSGMRIGAVSGMPHDEIRAAAQRLGPPETTVSGAASPLVEEIIAAARSLDERRVAQLLDRPLMLTSGEEVVHTLYLKLLRRAGDLWHAGQLSVGVEHFLEKMVTARILTVLQATPQPVSGELALCACPPDDRHEVGLFAAALTLKGGGFPVTILGADMPVDDLNAAVASTEPSLLVLAITSAMSAATSSATAAMLESGPASQVPLILGGINARAFAANLRRQVTVVDDMSELVPTARRLAR